MSGDIKPHVPEHLGERHIGQRSASRLTREHQLAIDLARIHGSRVTALYVVDPYSYWASARVVGETNPMGFQAYMSAAHDNAAQAHAQVAALCDKGGKPVQVTLRMAEDVRACQGIVNAANEAQADLIVVGSHGRSGLGRMLLGSVAATVVAQSPVPVLVAR